MQKNPQSVNALLTKSAFFIVIIATLLFTSYYYSPFLFQPSEYIFADKNDALKNYYCFEWHVHNDTSLINYSGSNYPFGENHGYTDGHPLLGNFIKVLPILKNHSIALLNLSIVLSFLFCAILIFKILNEFRIHPALLIVASIGITILCPQVFRIRGHLALSYSFFLPLIIYFLLLYEKGGKYWRVSLLISFAILSYFFTHPYLGMIGSAFILLYWIIKFLFESSTFKIQFPHFVVQAVLPLIIFFSYTKLSDNHSDRPVTPYGFLYFTSNIESVFISTLPPFRHVLSQLYKIREQNWEGIAYVGICSTITFLILPFYFLKNRKRIQQNFRNTNSSNKALMLMFASSLFLLLFSMGYPFKWNMEWLLDHLNFVKQFRAPGRFAWVFYFIATIVSVVFISNYGVNVRKSKIRLVFVTFFFFLFLVEGIPYHELNSKQPLVKNSFKYENLEAELKTIVQFINKDKKAQAIIPFPFFHIGTDYFDFEGTPKIKRASLLTCYHTNTPLMANITPRTSIEESRMLIGLFGSDMADKEIKKYVEPDKTFLMLSGKENLTEYEDSIFYKGNIILETQNYVLKKVSFSELFASRRNQKMDFFTKQSNSLSRVNNHFLTDSSFFMFKRTFSNDVVRNEVALLEVPPNNLEANKVYEFSFCFEFGADFDINYELLIIQKGKDNNDSILSRRKVNSMPNIKERNIIASLIFKTEQTDSRISCLIRGSGESEYNFSVRNIMLKGYTTDVYEVDGAGNLISINNISIKL